MSDDKLATLDNDTTSSTQQSTITALDIVLEPDLTMIQHAQAANAGLLKNFPKGYALGDEHAPHISVMGGYVYTASLDKIYSAAAKVLASEKVTSWKLKAFKYYYIPLKEIGLGGIVVEPTADLIRLQKKLIDATGPFMAPASSGTAAAFATTPDEPAINQPTIDAVATYLSGHTGEHYIPHVTMRRHSRVSGCPARCAVSHLHVLSRESVRLPVRQLRNCGETTPLLQAKLAEINASS
jgi:hypothetical protein